MTEQSEFPVTPVTLDELVVRWATRDAEYAKARTSMPPDQIAAIRHMRMQEAGRLPVVTERATAYGRANTWAPPVHPEFGSVKDWLE